MSRSGSISSFPQDPLAQEGGFADTSLGLDQVLASSSSSTTSLSGVSPPNTNNTMLMNNPWDASGTGFTDPIPALEASLASLPPISATQSSIQTKFPAQLEGFGNMSAAISGSPIQQTLSVDPFHTSTQISSAQSSAPVGLNTRPLDPWASSSPTATTSNFNPQNQNAISSFPNVLASSAAADLFDARKSQSVHGQPTVNAPTGSPSRTGNSPARSNGSPRRRVYYAKTQDMIRVLPGDWTSPKDIIELKTCPQKVGFVFKHWNYTVASSVHGVTVTRRYSDFVWLADVLSKRYPFRVIPDLPPKQALKVSVSGEDTFLEDRRRGLKRFISFLANHPVLRKDDLLINFLTWSSDISTFRNASSIVTEEEFTYLQLSEEMLASVPENVHERVMAFVRQARDLLEQVEGAMSVIEGVCEAYSSAGSYIMKHSISLSKMTEHLDCIFPECTNCPQINNRYSQMSEVFQNMSSHYLEHKQKMRNGFLEDLRSMRDFLTGIQNMYHRADRVLSSLTIMSTLNRINANQSKLSSVDPTTNRGEYERLLRVIDHDRRDLEYEQARSEFIYFCLWSELAYYHHRKSNIASTYRYFFEDSLEQEKVLVSIWEKLFPIVGEMPTNGF